MNDDHVTSNVNITSPNIERVKKEIDEVASKLYRELDTELEEIEIKLSQEIKANGED